MSNKTKHTPGPWHVIKAVPPHRGFSVTLGEPHNCHDLLRVGEAGGGDLVRAEDEANSKLIAAAPDLLEACEIALNHLGNNADSSKNNFDTFNVLRLAISKATGQ